MSEIAKPQSTPFDAHTSHALDAIEDELQIVEAAYQPILELMRRRGFLQMSVPAVEAHAALFWWRDALRTWRAAAESEWRIPA